MSIQINKINNFHQLTTQQAQGIIYGQIVPACESKGICLSSYGNHSGQGTLANIAQYNEKKNQQTLFNVDRIKTAYLQLGSLVQPTTQYTTHSYGLKHAVEKAQNNYITNGDLIVAMLLHGHKARFGKQGSPLSVNCDFKAKWIGPDPNSI
jgi:hypothetical protein